MTDYEFFIKRIEQQARFWDDTRMPLDLAWWWLQGAKFIADGPEWDVIVDLQSVVQAIDEGQRK